MTTHHEVEISPLHPRAMPAARRDREPHRRRAGAQYGNHGRQRRARRPRGRLPRRALALEAQYPARLGEIRPHRRGLATSSSTPSRRRSSPARSCSRVEVPVEDSSEGYRYEKLAHPASGFAVVGVAARISKSGGQDHDGADRRHRHGAARLPRARGRGNCSKAARTRAGHRDRGRRGEDANSDLYADCRVSPPPGARLCGARALAAALSRAS